MRVLAKTKDMGREEWLNLRRKGIGGSEAGAICGLGTFSTPFSVWADKLGLIPEKEDTERLRQGRDLEEYVAKRFCEETGKKVRHKKVMLQHDEHDFMIADIDREIVGEQAGLECKITTSLNLKKLKNGEYPDQYYVQCMHYMAVTGWKKWYLAILVLGTGFYIFEIERDEDEISTLIRLEKEFWHNHVLKKVPPDADGTMITDKALTAAFLQDEGGECFIENMDSVNNIIILESEKKRIERDIRSEKQKLKILMKGNEVGVCSDGREITWKRSKRAFISKELLLKTYPNIDLSKVMKVTSTRTFRIKDIPKI